ncbi:MAG: hypothetical protein HQK77_17720 [Desulfobacterales bacterium]|nr:hypothetical protein [Desulfobacterales bacterium]
MNNTDMLSSKDILVIDQTIREGMQYQGIVFSAEERIQLFEYQEALGVDICQAGYPSAHESEVTSIQKMRIRAQEKNFHVRIAALGRATENDVICIHRTGIHDYHLHVSVYKDIHAVKNIKLMFYCLKQSISQIQDLHNRPRISITLLDIGKIEKEILKECAAWIIDELNIDILSLPDTSGIMTPDQYSSIIQTLSPLTQGKKTRISVHCHNDMGMATANTIMGVLAGASVIEASALGIGERNGIADLYIVGRCLKEKGYQFNLRIDDLTCFQAYYHYVNQLCIHKTGKPILHDNTPFWGNAVKTHVAGTHALSQFGLSSESEYFLNVLCGRHLLLAYLQKENIHYDTLWIQELLNIIKTKSVQLGRAVQKSELLELIKMVAQ